MSSKQSQIMNRAYAMDYNLVNLKKHQMYIYIYLLETISIETS